jgi:hypothetical protein
MLTTTSDNGMLTSNVEKKAVGAISMGLKCETQYNCDAHLAR